MTLARSRIILHSLFPCFLQIHAIWHRATSLLPHQATSNTPAGWECYQTTRAQTTTSGILSQIEEHDTIVSSIWIHTRARTHTHTHTHTRDVNLWCSNNTSMQFLCWGFIYGKCPVLKWRLPSCMHMPSYVYILINIEHYCKLQY